MNHLKIYTREHINTLTRKRHLESKIGEHVDTIKHKAELNTELAASKAKFVLVGLPEDIGVRANYGRGGTQTAWKPALENILNIQSNDFLHGEELLVLGHVDFDDLIDKAAHINSKDKGSIDHLRKLVEFVDFRVFEVVKLIVSCGKIPIIIGGGHNNSYPNIKGTSEGLRETGKIKIRGINVINCDPHTDFRPLEGRHSGNGFSYAFEENILAKYAVLGIHESYNTEYVLEKFKNNDSSLFFNSYEDIFIREKLNFNEAIKQCCDFCADNYCGIELDMDVITNVPSSAKTSSGLSPVQARQYVYHTAKKLNAAYLHICEAAPILAHIKADIKTGKLIAYLVSDFIKGVLEKEAAD